MLPHKKNILLSLEQRIEQEAQEFKRRRLKEELDKLAAEEQSEALSPPERSSLQPGQDAPADAPDDRRAGDC